jgi:hypothetical protein
MIIRLEKENVHSDTVGTLNQFPFGKVPLYDRHVRNINLVIG